jgi:hypothetical protein
MTAQTVLPDDVGVLPQARDNAATIARPDTSTPFAGDGSRRAVVRFHLMLLELPPGQLS